MKSILLIPLALFFAFTTTAQKTLSVDDCRKMALQTSPLQAQKGYAERVAELQNQNLKRNNLPKLALNGQATWQTDVFELPFDNPFAPAPMIPQDQYRVTMDASQRIWDGGYDRALAEQQVISSQITAAQTDVDVFAIRETVTDLYFKALLLQESERILEASLETLDKRLKQAEALVQEGVALRTSADQVRIQISQTKQQLVSTQIDQKSAKKILGAWIGMPEGDFSLSTEGLGASFPEASGTRPEYALLETQKELINSQNNALKLRLNPRIEAFGQAGYGQPNPLNFFETGFEPFGIIGIRASWTPVDWGNNKRTSEMLTLQARILDARREALDQQLEATRQRDLGALEKAQTLLQNDDSIIALQEDIVERADAQVQNGVMTTTDYLTQVNLLTQARLTRKTHELQVYQAVEMYKSRYGQ